MTVIAHELAFAMYAQQRFGGLGDDVDLNRARLFWQAEDAEQQAMWRSKARGVLRACNLIESCPNCERLRWREQEREDYWQTRLREAKDEEIQARIETELHLRGVVDENKRLRLQVAALENDGMELAAKLGEAEEQIARLTASRRQ